MARLVGLALVLTVLSAGHAQARDETPDSGGGMGQDADLTGVNDAATETDSNAAPDLTVGSALAQQFAPAPAGWPWDPLAVCESSNTNANTGNGYFGYWQEDLRFWRNYGGLSFAARPDLASRAAQLVVAIRGQSVQGWPAWPVCSRRLGLR